MRVPLLPPGGPIKICPEAFTSGQIYVLKHGEAPGLVLQEGVRQGVDVLPGGLGAEADADGPGGGLFIQAHGGENVACLSPVAGGPGEELFAAVMGFEQSGEAGHDPYEYKSWEV